MLVLVLQVELELLLVPLTLQQPAASSRSLPPPPPTLPLAALAPPWGGAIPTLGFLGVPPVAWCLLLGGGSAPELEAGRFRAPACSWLTLGLGTPPYILWASSHMQQLWHEASAHPLSPE